MPPCFHTIPFTICPHYPAQRVNLGHRHSLLESVRSCPNVTAHFLTTYELDDTFNLCQSPISNNAAKPGGGDIYIENRGKKEKTRVKNSISRAAEPCWLLVQAHLKKIPKQEGAPGWHRGQGPWKAADRNSPNESWRPGQKPACPPTGCCLVQRRWGWKGLGPPVLIHVPTAALKTGLSVRRFFLFGGEGRVRCLFPSSSFSSQILLFQRPAHLSIRALTWSLAT